MPRAASGDAVPESEGVGWCASGAFGPFGLKTGRDETGERDDGRREGGSSCSSSRAVGVGLTTAGPVFARMSGMFGAKV